jgi:hypothetical protein
MQYNFEKVFEKATTFFLWKRFNFKFICMGIMNQQSYQTHNLSKSKFSQKFPRFFVTLI